MMAIEEVEQNAPPPSEEADPVALGQQVAEQTVVLELMLTGMGFRRSFNSAEVVETEKADAEVVHTSKDLIDPKEMKAVRVLDGKFKQWLTNRSVPSKVLRGGMYLVPASLVESVEGRLEAFKAERAMLLARFADRYEEIKAAARVRLKQIYDEADYPPVEAVLESFQVQVRYPSMDVDEKLKDVSRALWERERRKAELMWAEAAEEVREGLRVGFTELVARMADRLGTDETGKKRVFRDSMVEQMNDSLSTFEARNLTSDVDLTALVEKTRALMRGVNADELRQVDSLRDKLRDEFETIAAKAGEMVTTRARKFSLDADV